MIIHFMVVKRAGFDRPEVTFENDILTVKHMLLKASILKKTIKDGSVDARVYRRHLTIKSKGTKKERAIFKDVEIYPPTFRKNWSSKKKDDNLFFADNLTRQEVRRIWRKESSTFLTLITKANKLHETTTNK